MTFTYTCVCIVLLLVEAIESFFGPASPTALEILYGLFFFFGTGEVAGLQARPPQPGGEPMLPQTVPRLGKGQTIRAMRMRMESVDPGLQQTKWSKLWGKECSTSHSAALVPPKLESCQRNTSPTGTKRIALYYYHHIRNGLINIMRSHNLHAIVKSVSCLIIQIAVTSGSTTFGVYMEVMTITMLSFGRIPEPRRVKIKVPPRSISHLGLHSHTCRQITCTRLPLAPRLPTY